MLLKYFLSSLRIYTGARIVGQICNFYCIQHWNALSVNNTMIPDKMHKLFNKIPIEYPFSQVPTNRCWMHLHEESWCFSHKGHLEWQRESLKLCTAHKFEHVMEFSKFILLNNTILSWKPSFPLSWTKRAINIYNKHIQLINSSISLQSTQPTHVVKIRILRRKETHIKGFLNAISSLWWWIVQVLFIPMTLPSHRAIENHEEWKTKQ